MTALLERMQDELGEGVLHSQAVAEEAQATGRERGKTRHVRGDRVIISRP